MKRDFDYLRSLLSEFFEQKNIQDKLIIIHEQEISGWETWFQIEFSLFLHQHDSEPEWGREVTLFVDQRKSKEKTTIRPDFIIRKKGWQTDRYMAVEVKANKSANSCINNMLKDFEKLATMRKSELDVRSYWGLGIFEKPNKDIATLIADKAEEGDFELSKIPSVLARDLAIIFLIRLTVFEHAKA